MKKLKSISHKKNYKKTETIKIRPVKILDEIQLDKISNIENKRDKAIILFVLNTGVRVSELVDIDYNDIFDDIRTKNVKNEMKVVGKGNKERIIPLNQIARQSILSIHEYNKNELRIIGINKNYPLIITRNATRPTIQAMNNVVRRHLKTNIHVLRHHFLTELRNNEVALDIIQTIAGHSDIKTTARYYCRVN